MKTLDWYFCSCFKTQDFIFHSFTCSSSKQIVQTFVQILLLVNALCFLTAMCCFPAFLLLFNVDFNIAWSCKQGCFLWGVFDVLNYLYVAPIRVILLAAKQGQVLLRARWDGGEGGGRRGLWFAAMMSKEQAEIGTERYLSIVQQSSCCWERNPWSNHVFVCLYWKMIWK